MPPTLNVTTGCCQDDPTVAVSYLPCHDVGDEELTLPLLMWTRCHRYTHWMPPIGQPSLTLLLIGQDGAFSLVSHQRALSLASWHLIRAELLNGPQCLNALKRNECKYQVSIAPFYSSELQDLTTTHFHVVSDGLQL